MEADFFENYGLYQPYQILTNYSLGNEYYNFPTDFDGTTFDYYCENEQKLRTFELKFTDDDYSRNSKDEMNFKKDGRIDYIFTCKCECKSCKEYDIFLTLHVYSNNAVAPILNNLGNHSFDDNHTRTPSGTNVYIQKIGCFPERKTIVDKSITKHFDRETNSWYYKALELKNANFGIGSFAYFRRIIEKELITLVKEISEIPDSDKDSINLLLEKYTKTSEIYVIYENIFHYLPASLKGLGDNPIKLLYNQTSEGLHSLSDEECLERANNIALVLEFVIKKINEEKSSIFNIKNAIKNLKSGRS